MMVWWVQYQLVLQIFLVGLLFVFLAIWEKRCPWRLNVQPRWYRWANHGALAFLSLLAIKLLFPAFAIGVALAAQKESLGVFYRMPMPYWAQLVLGMIVLDLTMYWLHRLMHRFHVFWCFHRVHHMDLTADISTGLRFHPIEVLFVMAMKCLTITFFGVTPLAVLLYEIFYYSMLLFAHANVNISMRVSDCLQTVFVTPRMHRIHHSDYLPETNSNYGFVLSVWDKLFGTYTKRSHIAEAKLILGCQGYREPKFQTLQNMLLVPFGVKALRAKALRCKTVSLKTQDSVLKKII